MSEIKRRIMKKGFQNAAQSKTDRNEGEIKKIDDWLFEKLI